MDPQIQFFVALAWNTLGAIVFGAHFARRHHSAFKGGLVVLAAGAAFLLGMRISIVFLMAYWVIAALYVATGKNRSLLWVLPSIIVGPLVVIALVALPESESDQGPPNQQINRSSDQQIR